MRNRYSKQEPLVSVIVPTYNRPTLLRRTLESLITQSYKNLDIIVVNDAGVFDVSKSVESYGDSRIQYMVNEKNLGLAGTRNVALRHIKGDYVCLLDDDDIYLPYTIEFRMYMIKKLGVDIVYTRALQDIWEVQNGQYVSVHKQLYWDSHFDKDLILIQNIAPCCCPLFSRKSWEDVGYWFDETMTTSEDHDFWCAMSRKYDFHELKIVDAECSIRKDNTQMTGSLNFAPNWIKIFKRWRGTAIDKDRVINSQNAILKRVGINPEEHGL